MAYTQLSLTFGIEIETIILFHEDRLHQVLAKHSLPTEIVRHHSEANLTGLRHRAYINLPYNSWGIRASDGHEDTVKPTVSDTIGEYRAYKDEPLRVVQNLVADIPGCQNVSVHYRYEKQDIYNEWSINSDGTLYGLSKEEMVKAFGDRVPSLQLAEAWDSYGAEFASPPYSDPDLLREDTRTILTKVQGDAASQYGAFVNDTCAFHVHVGLPNNDKFSLLTLQHLAILLVIFEDQISLLHAPSRRNITGADCAEIVSNRENFFLEGEIKLVDHNGKKFKQLYQDLSSIKATLLNPSKESASNTILESANTERNPAASHKALSDLLDRIGKRKGHVVNFSGLVKDGRPNTVEFRQHAGTTDAEEMYWWVRFCTAMVQLAHRYASTGEGCPIESWTDDRGVEVLFEFMGFPKEGREFYRRKMEAYLVPDGEGEHVGVFIEADEFDIEDWEVQEGLGHLGVEGE